MRIPLLADRRPSVGLLGIWVVGVLLTTLLAAETAPAAAVGGGHSVPVVSKAPVASKRTSHRLPNVRKGIKNELKRYFRPLEGKSRVETFWETWSRFKSFVAASATRWTFSEPLRTRLKGEEFTSVSTKEMGSRSGLAFILVDGRYEVYLVFPGEDGKAIYAPVARQGTDPNDDRPELEDASSGDLLQENQWPPAGAAKYGMFLPNENYFDKNGSILGQHWDNVASLASRLKVGERMSVEGTNSQGSPFGFTMESVLSRDGKTGLVQLWSSRGVSLGGPRKLQEVITLYKDSGGFADSMLTVQKITG